MLDESGIGWSQEGRIDVAAADHRHQRTGIVIDTIAMVAIRHSVDRMLQHADPVAHPFDCGQRQWRGMEDSGCTGSGLSGWQWLQ